MMGHYKPAEPLAHLIDQLKNRWDFSSAGGQTIHNEMIVLKGSILLAQTATFNEDVW